MSLLARSGSARRERSKVGGVFARLGGMFRRGDSQSSSRQVSGGFGLAVLALLTLGSGYVAGNLLPWRGAQGLAIQPLAANGSSAHREPVTPGPIEDDSRALSKRFLVAAAYREKSMATAAARSLREQGIGPARALEFAADKDGPVFGLVVYFDNDQDRAPAQAALRQVRAPDDTFDYYRKTQKDWPLERVVR
jgi:hypothetical protein